MKTVKSIIGIVIGTISIIEGIVVRAMDYGSYEYGEIYGGDAYTGIQNASAQSANNVYYLSRIVQQGFCALLIVIGLVFISFSVLKLTEIIKENKKKREEDAKAYYNNFYYSNPEQTGNTYAAEPETNNANEQE